MTHFRKRFDPDFINEINEHIVQKHQESESAKNDSSGDDDGTPPSSDSTSNSKPNQESKKAHQGKLLLDATCAPSRSEEHTSELQSRGHLVCRLLLEKKKNE